MNELGCSQGTTMYVCVGCMKIVIAGECTYRVFENLNESSSMLATSSPTASRKKGECQKRRSQSGMVQDKMERDEE